jgi:hypothetical protein
MFKKIMILFVLLAFSVSNAQIVNQKLSGMWQAGKDYRPFKKWV